MRIGIMTFHWATNYGAVLQAYCLQEYLRELGHDVEIINYKPKRHDMNLWNYLKRPANWKKIRKFQIIQKKEKILESFRNKYLYRTKRFCSINDLQADTLDYDILISGSDQVLNSFYTMSGEGKPTSAYYLNFGRKDAKRIGYAVSFGCVVYPETALEKASEWIQCFDAIGVRENSGLDILNQLSFKKQKRVVPDPTILYGKKFFGNLGVNTTITKEDYICVYMLRKEITIEGNVRYIDDTKEPLSMEQWLTTITQAKFLVTNSYHGSIMAILSHVPFVVLVENGETAGMNDRFQTLLSVLGLSNRILNDSSELSNLYKKTIDWNKIDSKIEGLAASEDMLLKELKF